MLSVGQGTWKADPGAVGEAVIAAVKAGYRHINCARVYGNEKEIGTALKQLFSTGVVKCSDLWITSKLWCSDHAPEDVSKALSKTLEDLQLDCVDLYLTECRGGLVCIWASTSNAKVPPAVNQVECHPFWRQPALHFCKSTAVHLSALSPLGLVESFTSHQHK